MKKNLLRIFSVILAVVICFSSVPITMATDNSDESISPLKVEFSTNKSSYGITNTVKISVKITNISDEPVENISAEVILDKLTPIGRKSKVSTEKDVLDAGESFDFSCKAIVDGNEIKINFFQNFILKLTKLFSGNASVSNNDFNDGRFFVDEVENISIGNNDATEIVRVWYGSEMDAKDRMVLSNNGVNPEVTMDEVDDIPSFIDGKFTNRTVLNEDDALEAISDISDVFGIEDVEKEFQPEEITANNDTTFYRFQQYCNGIEVYGNNFVVAVDEESKDTEAISCDYAPNLSFDDSINFDEAYAIQKAKNLLSEDGNVLSCGKVIYDDDEGSCLAWKIYAEGVDENGEFKGFIFVNTANGEVCFMENEMLTETVTASSNVDGKTYNYSVWKQSDSEYSLYDSNRNFVFFDAERNIINAYIVNFSRLFSSTVRTESGATVNVLTSSSLTGWTDRQVLLYNQLKTTHDYFLNVLDRNGYNGKGGPTLFIVDYRYRLSNGSLSGNNACANTMDGYAYIKYGSAYAPSLDVVVHEYMHNVESTISDMIYSKESGALMEAYSDILGEVVENDTTWQHFTNRNLANPNSRSMPSYYKGSYWYTGTQDYGGVHTNNSVVAHAAYYMQRHDIPDMDELGALWYNSLFYLQSNAKFADCRAAVLSAAYEMHMSEEKIQCIKDAFDYVGITNVNSFYEVGSLGGTVSSLSNNAPIEGAEIKAFKLIGTIPALTAYAKTYADSNGRFSLILSTGVYMLTISAPGYKTKTTVSVAVVAGANYMPQNILLEESTSGTCQVGGKITNALNGQAIANATIRFRENHGNQTGAYVKNSDGSVLSLTTSSNGSFYTVALPAGYYTMEISCDGFITGYADVVSGTNSSVCGTQNASITPVLPEGQYRIVLTWGENPRDLDSHITGPRSDGSEFHVYFSNMNAYDGNHHVVNLDVDDISSYGPETITLNPSTNGTYRYFIYHYSGSGSISTSSAQIKLYKGNSLIATYNAPTDQGTGRYWTVFEITNGQVKNINKIGNGVYQDVSTNSVSTQSVVSYPMPDKDY